MLNSIVSKTDIRVPSSAQLYPSLFSFQFKPVKENLIFFAIRKTSFFSENDNAKIHGSNSIKRCKMSKQDADQQTENRPEEMERFT
jgi:hypothetical protein